MRWPPNTWRIWWKLNNEPRILHPTHQEATAVPARLLDDARQLAVQLDDATFVIITKLYDCSDPEAANFHVARTGTTQPHWEVCTPTALEQTLQRVCDAVASPVDPKGD